MAEARFIKTVTFGGYDKGDVIRRMEFLNNQVYDLKNELRETKLLLEAYKKGSDEEKAHESVMAGEKVMLTQAQVQNETLTTKLKTAEDENKNYERKVSELSAEISELKEQLKVTGDKLKAYEAGSDAAALSNVFIEAQKSADMLVNTAKTNADKLAEDSKKLAETTIAEANDEAAQIIFEAERTAAEKIAESENRSEEMKAATNNLKAVMYNDIELLGSEIDTLKTILEAFRENGLSSIEAAGVKLKSIENTLTEGGVPVFRDPQRIEPDVPEAPKRTAYKEKEEEEKLRKKNELDKLKMMAQSIGGKKDNEAPLAEETAEETPAAEEAPAAEEDPKGSGEKKGGKIDLAALAAQANALGGKK